MENKSITFGKAIDSNLLSLSKEEIVKEANQIIENFDADMLDTISTISLIRKAQLLIDTLEKGLKEKGITELQRAGGKLDANGCEHSIVEAGVKYDYSNNIKWVMIDEQIKSLTAERKNIEERIKPLRGLMIEVDPSTGEAIEWHPAIKSSTTTIKTIIK